MRIPLLLADFIHARACRPKCEKFLTRPNQNCCLSFFDFRSSFEKSKPPFLFILDKTNGKFLFAEVILCDGLNCFFYSL